MAIVPVAYDIPEDIHRNLLTGEWTRFGSVVRDGERIVTHLREVPLPVEDIGETESASAAAAFQKSSMTLLGLGIAAVVAAAVVGGVAYWIGTKRAKAAAETAEVASPPPSVLEYNEALTAYLEAVQSGTIDSALLNRLDAALEAVQSELRDGELKLDFSIEQSTALVSLVIDYTRKLAEANAVQIDEHAEVPSTSEGNPIVDMREWLAIQKRILDDAA